MDSLCPPQSTGLPWLPQLLTPSRIRVSAVHAGLSQLLLPWKATKPSEPVSSSLFLSKTSFHAHSSRVTSVATVACTPEPGITPRTIPLKLRPTTHTPQEPPQSPDLVFMIEQKVLWVFLLSPRLELTPTPFRPLSSNSQSQLLSKPTLHISKPTQLESLQMLPLAEPPWITPSKPSDTVLTLLLEVTISSETHGLPPGVTRATLRSVKHPPQVFAESTNRSSSPPPTDRVAALLSF